MDKLKATRVIHRGKTAIRVEGPNIETKIVGGARAERCDFVIVMAVTRWVRRDDGGIDWVRDPIANEVVGVRACEAAAYAEAERLPRGQVIRVERGDR